MDGYGWKRRLRRATVKGVAIFALIALMVLALVGPAYGGVTGVTGRAFTLATMPWSSFGPLPVAVARDGTVWAVHEDGSLWRLRPDNVRLAGVRTGHEWSDVAVVADGSLLLAPLSDGRAAVAPGSRWEAQRRRRQHGPAPAGGIRSRPRCAGRGAQPWHAPDRWHSRSAS